jgi:hypothetical protein
MLWSKEQRQDIKRQELRKDQHPRLEGLRGRLPAAQSRPNQIAVKVRDDGGFRRPSVCTDKF